MDAAPAWLLDAEYVNKKIMHWVGSWAHQHISGLFSQQFVLFLQLLQLPPQPLKVVLVEGLSELGILTLKAIDLLIFRSYRALLVAIRVGAVKGHIFVGRFSLVGESGPPGFCRGRWWRIHHMREKVIIGFFYPFDTVFGRSLLFPHERYEFVDHLVCMKSALIQFGIPADFELVGIIEGDITRWQLRRHHEGIFLIGWGVHGYFMKKLEWKKLSIRK